MQASTLAHRMLKYLPVLAVVVVALIGMLIGQGLYPTPLDSRVKTNSYLLDEQNILQPLNVLGAEGSCGFGLYYTSLPVKCRMPDGSFIQAPGTSPYAITIPETK